MIQGVEVIYPGGKMRMVIPKSIQRVFLLWGLVPALAVIALVPSATRAQESESPAAPNPSNRAVIPQNGQSEEQMLTDELDCFNQACEQLSWDPYAAYNELAADGYAVTMTPEQWEQTLVFLAAEGAVAGSVAGDLLNRPGRGAETGAAIALAMGLVRSNYLNLESDPESQRVVARFERKLNNWNKKFAACLRPRGYRVPSW